MVQGTTDVKTPFLAGQTIWIRFQIIDKQTGLGFPPDTLTMSIYDLVREANDLTETVYRLTGTVTGIPVTSAIVNGQQAVDMAAFVDAEGQVEVFLTPEDTAIEVPAVVVAQHHERRLLFTWTWGSPAKQAKRQITIRIAPDRASVAA